MSEELYLPLDVNWEQLKRFNICANSFNFNEAARKIGTSASALLGQLDQLEEAMGYQLFKRINKNRSKTLTPEGELLKQATQQIFLFLSIPLTEQAKMNRSQPKVLRVITTEGLAKTVLFDPINEYLKQNPVLQLQLITKASAELIEPGEIVIRPNFLEQKQVRREYLLSYTYKLLASKEYIKAYGQPESPLDLINHKVLMFNKSGSSATSFHWKPEFNTYLTPAITSDSFEYLLKQCQEGQGIYEVADLYFQKDDLEEVFPGYEGEKLDLFAAYNKKSAHEQLIPDFVSFLKLALEKKDKA
jgi:DNA-binding transcriptional LysR family regulator